MNEESKTVIVGTVEDGAWIWDGDADDVADSTSSFAVEVPAALVEAHDVAAQVERARFEELLAATGFDEDTGRMRACCPSWRGDISPGTSWHRLMLAASGDENTWPLHEYHVTSRPTRRDLETILDGLPEEFYVLNHELHVVRRDGLSIEEGGIAPSVSSCYRCGWDRDDHADAGEVVDGEAS